MSRLNITGSGGKCCETCCILACKLTKLYSWTTTRYTKPVADQSQDVANATLDYDSGVLTFTFQRARNTGDSRDWTFSDSSDDCYYFIFPVGGGPQTSDGDFGAHSSTPKISQRKYCIGTLRYVSFLCASGRPIPCVLTLTASLALR